MERAAYPQRTCREPVAGQYQMYTCELPEHDGVGPCASLSVPESVARRDRWEAAQAVQPVAPAPARRRTRKAQAAS